MRTDPDDVAPDEPVASRRPFVLAGTAGFALGLLVMGLLWAGATSGSDATEDARAACASLERAGELPDRYVSKAAIEPSAVHHVTAARDLAAAAADANPAYQQLADHLDGVSRMVISLNFADPAGRRHLALAKAECGHV
jgi:hypothetical protein